MACCREQALITQFAPAAGRSVHREYIWQQLWLSKLPENVVSVVDLALWDLAGRVTGLPVHKLLGGARDNVSVRSSSSIWPADGRSAYEKARRVAGVGVAS